MQIVQTIQPLSFPLAGPPAEPTLTDGGFGQAFAEEPEAKLEPIAGGESAALPIPLMPTWVEVADHTKGVAAAAPQLTDMALVIESLPNTTRIEKAAPVTETMVAASAKTDELVAASLVLPETAIPPKAATPAEAVRLNIAPLESAPPTPVPASPRPVADTSVRGDGAAPGFEPAIIQEPVPAATADRQTAAVELTERPRRPVGESLASEDVSGRARNRQGGTRTSEPGPELTDPLPVPLPKTAAEAGPPGAANRGPDEPRTIAAPASDARPRPVEPLGKPGLESTLAEVREIPNVRLEQAQVAGPEFEPAPTDILLPPPRNRGVDVPLEPATSVALASAPAALPASSVADTPKAPGQVLSVAQPDATPVVGIRADTAPDADDRKGLLPGVWERLFTGILAPVLQQPGGLGLLAASFVSSAGGGLPAAGHGRPEEDADSEPEMRSKATRPSADPEIRIAESERPVAPLASEWLDLSPLPDAAPMGEEDAKLSAFGTTGSITPSTTSASTPQTASAQPLPQIAAQIGAALSRLSDGSTELALSPEELGKVRLKLKPDAAHPDRMVVMITFERPETLELFRKHAGELADALRGAGYSGADIGFGQEGGFASGSDRRDPPPATASEPALRPDGPGIAPPSARLLAGASLDLRL